MNPVTYKEQQKYRLDSYKTLSDNNSNIAAYKLGVKNTEEIFMERLRNKLTPIVNLIALNRLVQENRTNEYNNFDKLLKNNIESADIAVDEILNILES